MKWQEELLAALRERRLTPAQVLAELKAVSNGRTAQQPRSVVLGPRWRPWQPDAQSTRSGWPVFVVDCGIGRPAPSWSAPERTQRLTTRATTRESRFTDLAGQFLLWLQRTIAMQPNTALRVVALADSADVGLASGLAGMFRSVALERPRLLMQVVQVGRDEPVDFDLLENCELPGLLRLEVGGVGAQDWQSFTASAAPMPWRDGAAYIVTGGSGGLGRLFAGEIARSARRAHLVLVGRRPATPDIERELARLVAAGASAEYRTLDIAQPDEVRRLVREVDHSTRPLCGVLHCAGVVQDRHLVNKSTAEFEAVLRPKVDGIVALDEASANAPLDLFVAFSSLASVYGNGGQCDYAAANGFMDGYAAFRHELVARGERRGRSLSINWPLWRDGGMRADPSIVVMTAQSAGLEPLDAQSGLQAFYMALAADVPQAMVLYGDLARLSPVAALEPQRVCEHAAPADDRLLAERTVEKIKTLFSQLTLVPLERIDKNAPIERYGIESVAVTALNAEFAGVFGALPPTLIYEHQTLASLADYFCRDHAEACRAWCGLAEFPRAPEAGDATAEAGPQAVVLESFRERYAGTARSASVKVASANVEAIRPGTPTPVAIIGINGRYPGARDLKQFWANLERGSDAITEIPSNRWPVDLFFHPDKGGRASVGKYYCRWGGFLDGFAQFDPQFFGISPREAHDMDPQERLFIECCWATLEDAGYTIERLRRRHGSSVGVFVGVTKTGYERYAPELWARGDQTKPTTSFGSIANRVSYLLDLRGPSLPFDTMCSASLTALHESCEHLARGECELALAGGVNLYLHPSNFIELCAQGMLSPDGRCKSFGAGANGFVPGEGVGAVLLKPLARAVADRDHIHAVISSTSINHGGKTNGYTVPNPKAQASLIRRALDRANINARSISYLEAHGTGTELGDPVEISGLTQAFVADTQERGFCALGSLKSNIGHLEAAAGIAGLTKIVLQLRHRRLVPTLHSEPENPRLGLDATPFVLQRTSAPWCAAPGAPLRAGLSSFGAGGANAHIVVEEYVAPVEPITTRRPSELIFLLSARCKDRLRAYAEALFAALPTIDDDRMVDVAYTLQIGREAMTERLAIVAGGRDELVARLRAWLDGAPVEDVYVGRTGSVGDAIGELSGEEDLQPLVARWLAQRRYQKVLGLWVRGMNLDWPALLDTGLSRTLSLPTYPFEPREYWFDPAPASEPGTQVEAVPPTASAEAAVFEVGALTGNLTLVPLWNVITIDDHAALCPARADAAVGRTLVVNGCSGAVAAVRTRWPGAEAIELDRNATVDDIERGFREGGVPVRIVWVVPAMPIDRGDDALFNGAVLDAQADGVRLGFRLIKALLAVGAGDSALDLRAVTYRTQRVLANRRVEPAHASVHGLVGAVAKEYPNWSVSLLDLEDDSDWSDSALTNLPPDPRGRPWARRGARWHRPVLVPQQRSVLNAAAVYRKRGVYVVIGGAGHIGALWSEHIVRCHDAQVVWIGRRPLDTVIGERIARVARAGRTPVYLRADATDADALARAADEVRARFGAIHGVVHAALVLEPRRLADLEEDEFLSVMGVKLATSVRAAQVFRTDKLDFLLFFSSLISAIKNAGQSHYAAGCCVADTYATALADLWRGTGTRVKVLNWGYWNKAENTRSDSFRHLEAMGIGLIGPDDGLPVVEALLADTLDQVGFMKTTKPVLVEGMSADEVVLNVVGGTPADVRGIAADIAMARTRRMLDDIPRGDSGNAGPMEALERALGQLLGAELGALARTYGVGDIAALSDCIDPAYARWFAASVEILSRCGEDAFALASDREGLWEAWRRDWEREDADSGLRARARLAESALQTLPDILAGRKLATDVLFQNASMEKVGDVYRGHTVADFFNATIADVVAAYARRFVAEVGGDASIRILEVGAGTGGTTRAVMERIESDCLPVAEYCYTDVSRAFLMHAEDVFKPLAPYLTCRLFDVEKSPVEQDMPPGSFDIVIATNVLHATRDIRRTLRNVKATLRRGGLIAINEMNSPSNLVTHLTFGLTKGWWLFEDASVRMPGSPGLTPESWKDVIEAEGYADVVWPAADAHALGQQIVIARSDGTVRVGRGRKAHSKAARAPALQAEPTLATVSTANDASAIEACVHDAVIDALAHSLRMDRDKIVGDEPFADFGLDSIIGIGFVRELNESLSTNIETTVIFDYSTVDRLTAHIVAEYGDTLAARVAVVTPAVVTLAPKASAAVSPVPSSHIRGEPIAVIGLAGRFAGSPDVDDLWAHLAAGDDLVTPVGRWDLSQLPIGGGCQYGSFIDHIDQFDPMFFSISGLEASYMDPKQRLFLEECWKALEVAGYAGEAVQGLRCGVYVGNEPGDYNHLFLGQVPGQAMWGVAGSVLPARIAYFLDLQGPAISVDTACSSSLVAVHLACQALWVGEIEMALAGGASVESTPGAYVGPGNAGMLSSRGRCYTFDARADGFVPGEGVGVVVLKRLSDALAVGDHVHGIVRGSGLNQDGTTNGITAPSARSQERLECDVYDSFGIDPASIGMVEAHGTGTELGDPIEFNALTRSFRRYTDRIGYCAIGSIKTNIGHAKAAAGIAGLLKILLAFRHKQIPASLHFENVNPNIDLTGSPFHVVTTLTDWPQPLDADGLPLPRRAAISAFGMSGTNAHLVLEEAPTPLESSRVSGSFLIVLSAMSAEQLRTLTASLVATLDAAPSAANLSLTLLLGRRHADHRLATVVADADELAIRLCAWLERGQHPRVHTGCVGSARRKEQSGLKRYGDACLRECAAGGLADAARVERLEAVADLYVQGYRLAYGVLFENVRAHRIPLPVYPFADESYWVPQPDGASSEPAPAGTPLHPLLHEAAGTAAQPYYSARFDGSEFFFADHVVNGRRILPGVAYLEMARAAWQHAQAASTQGPVRLRNVVWARPLDATDGLGRIELRLKPGGTVDEWSFEIASPSPGDAGVVLSQGWAMSLDQAERPRLDLAALRVLCADTPLDREGYYAVYAALGVDYGPGHRGIKEVHVGGGQALARLRVPDGLAGGFGLHPALLDSAFQATAALWLHSGGRRSQPSVPFALDCLDYHAPCPASAWAWIRESSTSATAASLRKLDIDLCDDDGLVCARLLGFTTRALSLASHVQDVLLFVPRQRTVEVAAGGVWPVCERLVLCFGLPYAQADQLTRRLSGVRVDRIDGGPDAVSRYRLYGVALLDRLAHIMASRSELPLLLQVIVADDDACAVGLNAMLRTARLEQPHLMTQMIVASEGVEVDVLALALFALPAGEHDCIQIADDGNASAVEWQPLAVASAANDPWRSRGVYLLTGGLGGLGIVFAREIAARTDAATVVLVGRSAATPQTAEVLASLSALGLRVGYRSVDIADHAATVRLVASIRDEFGRLDGVIHSAGVTADRLIPTKTVEELDAVFAAKVDGVQAIDAATADLDLDFIVSFSSMSGVMGSIGQADYAAANGFLDAFAARRNAWVSVGCRRGRCVSINWPYWAEGGMRTAPALQDTLHRRHGLGSLASEAGVRAFYSALASGADQVLVLAGDATRLPPLVERIGRMVSLDSAPAPKPQPRDATAFAERAVSYLRGIVADVLKLPVVRVDVDAAMERYGIDSLMAMDLTNALERDFGSLPKTLFYEYQSIAELAGYFKLRHADRLSVLLKKEEQPMHVKMQDGAKPVPQSAQRPAQASPEAAPRGVPHDGATAAFCDVAIVGMSGRFPKADTLDEFWENLRDGRDSITEVPRWRWDGVVADGPAVARWGGFIDGAAEFDPLFFGISPREALVLDPQERLFLQCAWTMLEHAGYTRQSLVDACPRGVGVYVGVMHTEYPYFAVQAQLAGHALAVTGSPASIANRVSYYCGFDGPSLAVDSMCSSSLTALHLACQALALGDCDAAIAGGVNLSLHPNKYVLLEQGNFASSKGRCHSFGIDGDGYVPSEGVGAVLLKPLDRAVTDGDRIHGVIKATGINHGGKTNGYTVPNPNAQARLIRHVLDRAGVGADEVGYVEAHGTGTSLGDPIEIAGLVKAFGEEALPSRCLIGSVKSNIGHCESAAGVASLCKVLLQLSHGIIAPSLHSAHLNPKINFADTPFEVVQRPTPWARRTVRRDGGDVELPRISGISSFGAGGANAHVIIAEHMAPLRPVPPAGVHAIVLSARTEEQLHARARLLVEAVQRGAYDEADLASIAYTLMVGREQMNWRLGCVADSFAALTAALSAFLAGGTAPLLASACILDREEALDAFRADIEAQHALEKAVVGGDLGTMIRLWMIGVAVPWARLYEGAKPLRIGLPGYPFAKGQYWYSPPRVAAADAPARPAASAPVRTSASSTVPIRQAPKSAVVATVAPAVAAIPTARVRPKPSRIVLGVPAEKVATPPSAASAAPSAPAQSAVLPIEQLRRELSESFASVLFMDVTDVDERRSFGEMGMDSVLAVEWIREINAQYGVEIDATDVYDHADIRAMAKLVNERLDRRAAGPDAAEPAAPPPHPPPHSANEALRGELRQSFANVLFMDVADVDERRSFGEMGMDSVLAVEWIRDINTQYGIAIDATDIYDHADIRAMAALVRDRLAAKATVRSPDIARAQAPLAPNDAAKGTTLGVDEILELVQRGAMTVDEAERLLAGGAT